MALADKLREGLEGQLAAWLTGAAVVGLTAIFGFAEYFFPESWLAQLGTLLSAQILLGLFLIIALLAIWIAHLRWTQAAKPKRTFIADLGVSQDQATGHYHCIKCEGTPLRAMEWGWYCAKCDHPYYTPGYLQKQKEQRKKQREEQDAKVRAFNQAGGWVGNWRK